MLNTIADAALKVMGAVELAAYRDRKSRGRAVPGKLERGFHYLDDRVAGYAKFGPVEAVQRNEYLQNLIVPEADLLATVERVLGDADIRNILLDRFGTPFSLDYFVFNRTLSIPAEKSSEGHYANLWHIDTLLTENCVKLFILPHAISADEGPLEFFDSNATAQIRKSGFRRGLLPAEASQGHASNRFTGAISRAALVQPRLCLHRAGVPVAGRHREQMMFQLNPSPRWRYAKDLFARQSEREITLPSVNSLFRAQKVMTFAN
ncbi:MAG TPA: hypothetical protein VNU97_13655 [Rhizomicrobium sp.]|jgi:hypothetical protein|nr:hypothetical protein [Rhizomicrobium sp.]